MRTAIAHTMFAAASIAITAAAVAASAPAAAATSDAARSVTVQTVDLDLRTAAGQNAAKHRIRTAVSQVCGAYSSQDLDGAACRHHALDSAEQALARLSAPTQIATR